MKKSYKDESKLGTLELKFDEETGFSCKMDLKIPVALGILHFQGTLNSQEICSNLTHSLCHLAVHGSFNNKDLGESEEEKEKN